MTYICFQLTMPGNNSWNGKWTGDDKFYARTRKFTPKRAAQILEKGSYGYNFGDGWYASVSVKEITGAEKRQIDKNTKGFCGYEWMIDSIVYYQGIYTSPPEKKTATA